MMNLLIRHNNLFIEVDELVMHRMKNAPVISLGEKKTKKNGA